MPAEPAPGVDSFSVLNKVLSAMQNAGITLELSAVALAARMEANSGRTLVIQAQGGPRDGF